jgi:hypothetical protein
LLLKVRFRIEFFDFRVEGKWRLTLSKYGAHTQDILLLFMSTVLLLRILLRKMAPNLEHVKRAPDSSIEPRTGSVTSFNVIPPQQHLHGRCLGLPVRGYDSSCGSAEILIAQLHSQSKLTMA